jgi:hypothetical protein
MRLLAFSPTIVVVPFWDKVKANVNALKVVADIYILLTGIISAIILE